MDAAVGTSTIALRCTSGMLAVWLALQVVPCRSQDTSISGLGIPGPSSSDRMRDSPASVTQVPQLSLTLGTPVVRSGSSGTSQALDLGIQWRQPVMHDRHVDVTAWRRMTPEFDAVTLIRQREPVYGARVEMNLQARQRGLVADRRFIGLQLDSGTRITLRRKDGNPTLYYRSQF